MANPDIDKDNSRLILYRLDELKQQVDKLEHHINGNYVSTDRYNAEIKNVTDDVRYLKNLVYGAVATFITLAIGAVVAGGVFNG